MQVERKDSVFTASLSKDKQSIVLRFNPKLLLALKGEH